MIAYLFPGQGSQFKGMGRQLFEQFPAETELASDVLGYSLARLCLEDTHHQLDETPFTQPALFVVNALSYQLRIHQARQRPDFLAGHSLGEYNALHAAGVFSFEQGVRLTAARGRVMGLAREGVMAAVIGPGPNEIQAVLDHKGFSGVYIANYNAPDQTVVAALEADIDEAERALVAALGASFVRLRTRHPFHSPYMAAARDAFADDLAEHSKDASFSPPTIPVVCNVTAQPYEREEIATLLAAQITAPVRWAESITYLLRQGVEQFEELGARSVLAQLIPNIRRRFRDPERDPRADAKPSPIARPAADDHRAGASAGRHAVGRNESRAAAQARVDDWNRRYPVGTWVRARHLEDELTTNSPAVVLFRHRAVVYVEGHNGYLALEDITPASG